MTIRKATVDDSAAIRNLLAQLGYPNTESFVEERLAKLLAKDDDEIFVYDDDGQVIAFISLHYTIHLGYENEFCEIMYFTVDENIRSKGVGRQLEEFCTQRAKDRGCEQMEVFSSDYRKDAHRFYKRQGYETASMFFSKPLKEKK